MATTKQLTAAKRNVKKALYEELVDAPAAGVLDEDQPDPPEPNEPG